jgi:hypothetical protein
LGANTDAVLALLAADAAAAAIATRDGDDDDDDDEGNDNGDVGIIINGGFVVGDDNTLKKAFVVSELDDEMLL